MKITLLTLAVLISTFSTIKARPQVLSVFKISRHGARAPNGPLQKEFMTVGARETADLTTIGVKQLKSLGRRFKQRYTQFRSFDISFYSSYKKRAIHSMFSFLHEYMGRKKSTKQILGEQFFHSNKFKQFNNEQLRYIDSKRDYIERVYDAAIRAGLPEAIRAHCLKCAEPIGHIKKLKLLKHMYTHFYCRRGSRFDVSKFSSKLVGLLRRGQILFYETVFLHENYVRTENHGLYLMLGKQLVSVLKKSYYADPNLDLEYYKSRFVIPFKVNYAMFLFAHDRNVLGLITALLGKQAVFTNSFFMPKFGSFVTIELISDYCKMPSYSPEAFFEPDKELDYYIKLVYQDREVFTRACGYTTCTVKEFLEFLDKNLDV